MTKKRKLSPKARKGGAKPKLSESGVPLTALSASGVPLAALSASSVTLTALSASGVPLTALSESGVPLTAHRDTPRSEYIKIAINNDTADVFLRTLSTSGDIALSAAKAGRDEIDFFDMRRANPVFRADWDAAIDTAIERMRSILLAKVLRFVQEPASNTEPRLMTVMYRLAMNLLSAHRAAKRISAAKRIRTAIATPQIASDAKLMLLKKLNQIREKQEEKKPDKTHNA